MSKITKDPKQKSRLGAASNEITGGLQLVWGRPTLALGSALVPGTLSCLVCMEAVKAYEKSFRFVGITAFFLLGMFLKRWVQRY